MLSEQEAIAKLKEFSSDVVPEKIIVWDNMYLILAPRKNDLLEGNYDPIFSVNMDTGAAQDYSIYRDGKAKEISELFLEAPSI
jgi:hypothetical protein